MLLSQSGQCQVVFLIVDCVDQHHCLRCAGNVPTLSLYTQYAAIICAIPVLRMFPSDIIVGVFKKKAAD